MDFFKTLILELGARLGVGVLEPNEVGMYEVVYDKKVVLQFFEAEGELILFSLVAEAPPGGFSLQSLRCFLVASYGSLVGSGSFGMNPATEQVEYAFREKLEGLTLEYLEWIIRSSVVLLLRIRQELDPSSYLTRPMEVQEVSNFYFSKK